MSRLNACPFCGSDRVDMLSKTFPHPPFKFTWIECHNCGAVVSFQENSRPEMTIAMYNGGKTTDLEELKNRQLGLKRWQRTGGIR